jgi:hypothetical protein
VQTGLNTGVVACKFSCEHAYLRACAGVVTPACVKLCLHARVLPCKLACVKACLLAGVIL